VGSTLGLCCLSSVRAADVLVPLNRLAQALGELDLRLEAEQALRLGRVGWRTSWYLPGSDS
jgi:hypothetical protein